MHIKADLLASTLFVMMQIKPAKSFPA